MSNFKDIITIVVLFAVLGILYYLIKSNKKQTELLVMVANKTGALKHVNPDQDEDGYEGEDDEEEQKASKKGKAGAPKSAPKKIHKQFLSLFEDGIPKTTGEIKQLYTKKFKELDKTKFNNTLQYMTKMGLLGKDKGESKQNFWAPIDWFDEDGLMYEDYLEKVSKS